MSDTIVIKIENVKSKLEHISSRLSNQLDTKLSCPSPNYWFSKAFKNGRWDGKHHFYSTKTNSFPTGLLPKVIEFLEGNEYEYQIVDNRTNTDFLLNSEPIEEIILNNGKALRDYQIDAVNVVSSNILSGIEFQRGIINIATNGGKTTIASAIIREVSDVLIQYNTHSKLNYIFLFLTHSKEIANQAKASFENDLDIPVGLVGDGKWNIQSITVALIPTLYSRHKRKDVKYKELCEKTVGFIGDEIHHSSSNSWIEVLDDFVNANMRLGLTGTVDKTEPLNEMKLYSVTGRILIKITNDYLIKHGYSAVPECYFTTIDYPDIDKNMRYFGQTGEDTDEDDGKLVYQDVYQKGIVRNTYRNYIISLICGKEIQQGNQVLVLVEHIEQGISILNILEQEYPDYNCIFLHGELSSEERQLGLNMLKSGDVSVAIATAILDEGVDVSNINAVIYARGMKSIRKLLQGIGRGLRKKADGSVLRFYDFIDDTSLQLLQHSLNRYKVLKKEKFQVKKLDLESDLGFDIEAYNHYMEYYDDVYDDTFVYVEENPKPRKKKGNQ